MPRIEFDGKGEPIPKIALPPFGSDSDLPPTVLTFTENADFSVTDYVALGFTHFEAWCVGAAGGRGGDAASQVVYAVEEVWRPVPQSVWNLQLELAAIEDYNQQVEDWYQYTNGNWASGFLPAPPQFGRSYSPGVFQGPPGTEGWLTNPTDANTGPTHYRWERIIEEFNFINWATMVWTLAWYNANSFWLNRTTTYAQAFGLANPSHLMRFATVKQVSLQPSDEGMGGGGGGGGFHKVAGALSDLDDAVAIVVGNAGVDAAIGQVHQNGAWVPDFDIPVNNPVPPASPLNSGSSAASIAAREAVLRTYLANYVRSYALPRTSFANPVEGQAGGASSFADVCRASGGEGGDPGMSWDGSQFVLDGDGGNGGIGGSLVAGGGGTGSVAEGVNGSDGIWIPETGIGGGGGGGKGGRAPTGGGIPPFGGTVTNHLATAGGQGSYSFADTSVFGARQFRQAWNYMQMLRGFDPVTGLQTGAFTLEPRTTTELIIPGGGGGARPLPNLKYGGRGTGFSPDGIVVLRLTKIT